MLKEHIFVTVSHSQEEAGFVWGTVLHAETQNEKRKQSAEGVKRIYGYSYHVSFQGSFK